MVRQVLHDYVRTLQAHLGRLPVRVQRRLTAEVVAHLEDRMQELRQAHPEWSEDEVAEGATRGFLDPMDMAIEYGEDGGLVRASTGEVVLRSNLLSRPAASGTFRWNSFAAAGSGVLVLLAASAVFILQPDVLFGGQSPEFDGLAPWDTVDEDYRDWNGTDQYAFTTTESASVEIRVAHEAGCLDWVLVSPSGSEHREGACGSEIDPVVLDEVGHWQVFLDGSAFTGQFRIVTA